MLIVAGDYGSDILTDLGSDMFQSTTPNFLERALPVVPEILRHDEVKGQKHINRYLEALIDQLGIELKVCTYASWCTTLTC